MAHRTTVVLIAGALLVSSAASGADAASQPCPPTVYGGRIDPRTEAPVYTDGDHGRVRAALVIGTDGAVREATILRSEPRGKFDSPTLKALKRWRFPPGAVRNCYQDVRFATYKSTFQTFGDEERFRRDLARDPRPFRKVYEAQREICLAEERHDPEFPELTVMQLTPTALPESWDKARDLLVLVEECALDKARKLSDERALDRAEFLWGYGIGFDADRVGPMLRVWRGRDAPDADPVAVMRARNTLLARFSQESWSRLVTKPPAGSKRVHDGLVDAYHLREAGRYDDALAAIAALELLAVDDYDRGDILLNRARTFEAAERHVEEIATWRILAEGPHGDIVDRATAFRNLLHDAAQRGDVAAWDRYYAKMVVAGMLQPPLDRL